MLKISMISWPQRGLGLVLSVDGLKLFWVVKQYAVSVSSVSSVSLVACELWLSDLSRCIRIVELDIVLEWFSTHAMLYHWL